MATNEVNGLLTVKDKDGNLYIVYPITKLENISDLEIATTSLDGLMSKADKAKLDGVAAALNSKLGKGKQLTNEDLNTITAEGFYHADSSNTCKNKPHEQQFGLQVVKSDTNSAYISQVIYFPRMQKQYIRYFYGPENISEWFSISSFSADPVSGQVVVADGTAGGVKTSGFTIEKSVPSNAVFTDTNTTYGNMTAATASAAGKAGLVPAPAAGKQGQFLRGDGTWTAPANTTYGVATESANGLMSAADKAKLNKIACTIKKDDIGYYIEDI